MSLNLAYIRSYYAVPAVRGGRVEYEGRIGTIIGSSSGAHVRVKLDGDKFALSFHPLDLRYIAAKGDPIDAARRGANDDGR